MTTETIGITVPGGASRHMCPPLDTASSCRGVRPNGKAALRFWVGAVCTTNNCANPGVDPTVDPDHTCRAQWGATRLGYNQPPGKADGIPGRGIQEPGWYDWKTGAWRVTLTKGEPTCRDLAECIGTSRDWDVAMVATPRPGQQVPCSATDCDDPNCFVQGDETPNFGSTSTTAAPTTTTTVTTTTDTTTTT